MSALASAARLLCTATTRSSCIERLLSGSQAQTSLQAFILPGLHELKMQPGRVLSSFSLSARSFSAQAAAAEQVEGLVLHDSAITRLKELQHSKGNTKLFLRLEVEGGGCSGFQYKFSIDEQARDDDVVYERSGVRVVCDPVSLDLVKGSTVEFEDSLMRSAFTVSHNPQSEASCGCGTSFAAKMKL